MTDIPSQKAFYVVQLTTKYASLQEAMQNAPDEMAAHIARSKEYHERGDLLMAGAFLDGDGPVGTMAVLTTREAAEEFASGDPFVLIDMVSEWHVREWANLFARP